MKRNWCKRAILSLPHGLRYWGFRTLAPHRFLKHHAIREADPNGYSLKRFDQQGALFIHIPKNGGTSINQALYDSAGAGHLAYYFMEWIYSPSELSSLFTFTFVRNPWDRLYSSFRYLQKGGVNASDRSWVESNVDSLRDFESFVMDWLNDDAIYDYVHFHPQHLYILSGRGKVELDFIGRFESFESDFRKLIEKLDVEAELQHMNASGPSSDYRTQYTDEMIEKVRRVYAKDIELLGYDF